MWSWPDELTGVGGGAGGAALPDHSPVVRETHLLTTRKQCSTSLGSGSGSGSGSGYKPCCGKWQRSLALIRQLAGKGQEFVLPSSIRSVTT